jgi:Na+-transporting NADH:ubiquinone oxidoreductase subunit NqrF
MVQRMKNLIVFGRASQKVVRTISITSEDLSTNLMELLLDNGIPVASSCNGEGACLKCILTANDEKILSCQIDLATLFLDNDSVTVVFSYL